MFLCPLYDAAEQGLRFHYIHRQDPQGRDPNRPRKNRKRKAPSHHKLRPTGWAGCLASGLHLEGPWVLALFGPVSGSWW